MNKTQELRFSAVQHYNSGRLNEAEQAYRLLLEQTPDSVEILHTLAQICYEQQKIDDSLNFLQQASSLDPKNAQIHYSAATILAEMDRLQEAVQVYQFILHHHPRHVDALVGLGTSFFRQMQYSEAMSCFDRVLMHDDSNASAHFNLATVLIKIGQTMEALEHLRRVQAIDPDFVEAKTCELFVLLSVPGITNQQIYDAHVDWGKYHARRTHSKNTKQPGIIHANQRIHVGYVSPDFRKHSVSYFIKPVLEMHDRNKVKCFCYSNVPKPDLVTESIKQISDHWRDISSLDDEQVVEIIRNDKIDILVDLSGHTTSSRLNVFAYKPAPVQVSWIGYPGTTGLPEIDYRITDNHADPEGLSEKYHTEQLVRLEPCFLCYEPPVECPETAAVPAQENGYITFGSFNNLSKYSEQMLIVWSKILQAVPDSKILLKAEGIVDKAGRERVNDVFTSNGISLDRVELTGILQDFQSHLKLYNRIDIALDTFPYNGTTTTCEALWMGVPVITLSGDRHASRVGLSLLSAAGVSELITESVEDYIAVAEKTARNIEHLVSLRKILRKQLSASALLDISRLVISLENTYRKMLDA